MQRSILRRTALQLLYAKLSGGETDEDTLQMIVAELPPEMAEGRLRKSDRFFIDNLLSGVESHDVELRNQIGSHLSEDWTMERLNRVDLCILLLGGFEILYSDLADGIVISEQMKLADLFTEEKNKRFINAVLGAISRSKPAEQKP